MEIYTTTKTALAPAFGMPGHGSACGVDVLTLAPAAAVQGTTVSIDRSAERTTGAFPVPHAWSPPI